MCSIRVVFVDSKGVEMVVMGRAGQNLVALAHENDIALEGACECSLACSTCHVVLEGGVYERLKAPVDEEEDLLDLAFGLTPTCVGCKLAVSGSPLPPCSMRNGAHFSFRTAPSAPVFAPLRSRLGCQVLLQPEMDSMRVTLPSATRNFYVDGHKPKPH